MDNENRNFTNIEKGEFDYSGLWQWVLCKRRGYYYSIRGLRLLQQQSALSWGGLVHKALQAGEPIKADEVVKTGELTEDDRRTRDLMVNRIREYYEKYPVISEPYKVISAETKMSCKLGDYTYIGIIDKIVKWNTDKLWVMEHKTVSAMTSNLGDMYSFEGQNRGYIHLVISNMGECGGSMVDMISSAANPKVKFMRIPIVYMEHEDEQWKINVIDQIREVYHCIDKKTYPYAMVKELCCMYGKCHYWDICKYGESIIPQRYEEINVD